MSKPTESDIVAAIQTLQAALVNKWGEVALNAADGDGCALDIRFGGVVLLHPGAYVTGLDESPEDVAAELVRPGPLKVPGKTEGRNL